MTRHLYRTRLWIAGLAILMSASFAAVADPASWREAWPETDFSVHAVPLEEIISGGPGRDGIPALDDPEFVSVIDKTTIEDREPVITVELGGAPARAYPIRYLMWHEIVNDTVAERAIAVTFCPLCNSAITFDRRLDGAVLTFGVTGKLRKSDMVMFDRQTHSWWQQAVGEGIVGVYTGQVLEQLPT